MTRDEAIGRILRALRDRRGTRQNDIYLAHDLLVMLEALDMIEFEPPQPTQPLPTHDARRWKSSLD